MAKVVAVLKNPRNDSVATFLNKEMTKQLNVSIELKHSIEKASHLQFTRDVVIDQENTMIRELQHLQCESNKANYNNA